MCTIWYNIEGEDMEANKCSLPHWMRAIACARASTRATGMIRVKNSTLAPHLFATFFVSTIFVISNRYSQLKVNIYL